MSLFGKGGDLIDYTYLQKRGIIKKSPEQKSSEIVRTKDGFVDLSKTNLNNIEKKEETSLSNQNPFGNMFDNPIQNTSLPENNFSNSSNANQTQDSGFVSLFDSPAFSSNASTAPKIQNEQEITNADINAVKIKIEDLEYKLSNLIDKISLVESKLDNFEKKVFN